MANGSTQRPPTRASATRASDGPTVIPGGPETTAVVNAQRQSIFRDVKLFVGAMAVAMIFGIIGATAVLVTDPFGGKHATGGASAFPPAESADALPHPSLESAAAKAVPSVVKLEATAGPLSETGSGIVLTPEGLILTTSQVVSALSGGPGVAARARTVATFADGRTAPFRVVGTDLVTDVAVVRAEGMSGLTPITFGRSADLRVGENVVAVGSPLGLESTVTTGVISALHRPVPTLTDSSGHITVLDAIQTDAAMNPGSVGGALIDRDGKLIGVNSVIVTGGNPLFGPSGSIGLGFAIPVDQAKRIAGELIATGKAAHAYLGVRLANNNDTPGAVIVAAQSGSPAAAAGLGPGMVVTRVDGRVIASSEALVAAILSKAPGNAVAITATDPAGATRTTQVILASDQSGSDATPAAPSLVGPVTDTYADRVTDRVESAKSGVRPGFLSGASLSQRRCSNGPSSSSRRHSTLDGNA
ncbi:trypsin-like peptidase domain-containing protein [Mycobacterium sp. SM1]|nr:trypsin-like peptidase domain-containing protein [Mycobacterium sp. SM1]